MHTHTYIHTSTHTHTHTRCGAHTHAYEASLLHAHKHMQAHTHTRTCKHTYTNPLSYTHTQIRALSTAARALSGKDECHARLRGIEREYWMGTEIGRLGGYGFQGTVTAGCRSNKKGEKMGAVYMNLRGKGKRKVGREEEGSN